MKTRDKDDFWGGLGVMAIRIDYGRTIKVLISSPVRWVMYFAPGRRQLKLKLRMRRKNSQLESTGGRLDKKWSFHTKLRFLTVVVCVDRDVSEVAEYEIKLSSLSS